LPRRNFRCEFNPYITPENHDGVILSVLAQFDSYFAEPEITMTGDNEFTLTVEVSDVLTPTMVRDKLLWNYFVHSVTAQEAIRKVQILRLPKSGSPDTESHVNGEGSVGAFGPGGSDSGVNEKFNSPQENPPSYIIGVPPQKELGNVAKRRFNSGLHYADPTQTDMPMPMVKNEEGNSINPEVLGDINDLESAGGRKVTPVFGVQSSRRYATSPGDAGGFFGDPPARATQRGVNVTQAPQKTRGRTEQNEGITDPGTAPPISFQGFFGNDPLVDDSFKTQSEHSQGPLDFSIAANKKNDVVNQDYEEGPVPPLGNGDDADGEPVNHGWFSASAVFGLNEHYTYESDVNDDFDF